MSAKYAFIAGEEGNYSVRSMCAWAKVSTSGYHHWKTRAPSRTALWRAELGELIAYLFADSDGTYGYRRIHAALARADRHADPHTVRSIMAERGLVACQPRAKGPRTTISSDAGAIPDLLHRDFTATEPGCKLVGDITYPMKSRTSGTPLDRQHEYQPMKRSEIRPSVQVSPIRAADPCLRSISQAVMSPRPAAPLAAAATVASSVRVMSKFLSARYRYAVRQARQRTSTTVNAERTDLLLPGGAGSRGSAGGCRLPTSLGVGPFPEVEDHRAHSEKHEGHPDSGE